ncbi:MAG: hypothetical protein J6B95_03990 [Oscillospiraceae bacterium]|nr:hypothetical protein [Oscillospiraceae bacterium]
MKKAPLDSGAFLCQTLYYGDEECQAVPVGNGKTHHRVMVGLSLGIGKKRGRKEDLRSERWRLTASAAFHGFILTGNFEWPVSDLKTK